MRRRCVQCPRTHRAGTRVLSYVPASPGALASNYIDGRFSDRGRRFANIDPLTGTRIGEVVEADREAVDAAVAAARRALHGEWGALDAAQRAKFLHAVADGI